MAGVQGRGVSDRWFGETETVDMGGVFTALRRRWWLVAMVVLLGTALGGTLGYLQTPEYTAQAEILVQPQPEDILQTPQGTLPGMLSGNNYAISTQVRLLASPALHARVMEDLGLFADPDFNPFVALREGEEPRVPRSGWNRWLSFVPETWLISVGLAEERRPLREDEVERVARETALRRFRNGLEIVSDESTVITVMYTHENPEKAAMIVNRLVDMFVDTQLRTKLLSSTRVSSWMEERLAELRAEVERAEAAVAEFRAKHDLLSPGGEEGPTLSDQELADLNRELIASRAELAEKRSRLALIRRLQREGDALDSVPEVAASPVIIGLRAQETELLRKEAELATLYGEKHPMMQQLRLEKQKLQDKIRLEIARIAAAMENDVRAVATRVAVLEQELEAAKTRTGANREVEVELRQLEREAQAARQLYENLLERYKELQRREQIVEPDVRIVAKATPPVQPSSPSPKLFAAIGFGTSFVFATFLALLLERFDRTFRSAREVEGELGLPVLARIPLLRLRRRQRPLQHLLEKPLSAYAEALRSVYTALRLGSPDRPPRTVCITSALPDEGKTTLAVGLALFAVRSGKRALLLDLDLRRPAVHRELGVQPRTGLVEFVRGEVNLEEAIHHDPGTGLFFVPVKARTSNPTDVLESKELRDLLDHARRNFDLVVMDTTPVGAVTDGRLAALLAERVVFAVRWRHTSRDAVTEAVRGLRELGVEPHGVVLTLVDFRKAERYGYESSGVYTRSEKYYME